MLIFDLVMSKCYQNFELFDFQTPQLPDDLLPLFEPDRRISEAFEHAPNLDIILSKFLNNDELNDIELQQLPEQERLAFEQVQTKTQVGKRPDEYQKLFYRRAFKFAEKQFFGKRKNKSRKMSCFYHHFFEKAAQRMNVPLVNFYHPDKKTRPGLTIGQKSFNRAYIRLLLRSEIFREVSRDYRQRFYQECLTERRTKLCKFTAYLRGVVYKCDGDRERMIEAIKSSKCKVPWSNNDIAEADRRAREDLQHYQLQFSETGGDEEQEIEPSLSSASHEEISAKQ